MEDKRPALESILHLLFRLLAKGSITRYPQLLENTLKNLLLHKSLVVVHEVSAERICYVFTHT